MAACVFTASVDVYWRDAVSAIWTTASQKGHKSVIVHSFSETTSDAAS